MSGLIDVDYGTIDFHILIILNFWCDIETDDSTISTFDSTFLTKILALDGEVVPGDKGEDLTLD